MPDFKLSLRVAQNIGRSYAGGALALDLARRFSVNRALIYASLARVGVARRASGPMQGTKNEHFFDELTPASAYWIGFLLADGSVDADYRRLTVGLRIDDHEQLVALKTALASASSIFENKKTKSCVITFVSPVLVGALRRWGVTNRKSLTAHVHPALKDDPHFWRGIIDGDGSVSAHWIPNKQQFDGRIRLTGSLGVCRAFQSYVRRAIGYELTIFPSRAVYSAEIPSMKACAELGKLLWADLDAAYYLPRKYEKYLKLCAHRTRIRPKRNYPTEVLARRALTRADAAAAIRAYKGGAPPRGLAAEYGVTETTILREVRRAGVAVRRPGRPDKIRLDCRVLSVQQGRKAALRYGRGEPTAALAEEFGVSKDTIRREIRRSGLLLRAPGRVNRGGFCATDSIR